MKKITLLLFAFLSTAIAFAQICVGVDLDTAYSSCEGDAILLDATCSEPDVTYQWFLNNTLLPSEINSTLNATLEGTYRVDAFRGVDFFSDETTVTFIELIVFPASDLSLCDDTEIIGPNDGIEIFDLTITIPQITGGNPDIVVTFFESQQDAAINENAISNPTNYQSGNRIIFIRAEEAGSGCNEILTLNLVVQPLPSPIEPTPLQACDDDNDGFAIFDLTAKDDEITGGATALTVTYFETSADANNNTNPITPANAYVNVVNPQAIFVRVTDNNSLCFDASILLSLLAIPSPTIITPTPLEVCDEDNDGFANFNLVDKDAEIIDGEPGITVTYHETLIEAENGTFALPSPYENIVANTQTIYARGTTSSEGCYSIVDLDLIVNNELYTFTPSDLVLVDENMDGTEIFDLSIIELEILMNFPTQDIIVEFFETFADAQSNTNVIADPLNYANITNPQTIYVLAINLDTGCSAILNFDLILTFTLDGDGDGIPDEDEDLNNNGNLEDDDTDDDGIPNYLDSDDDGDTVDTIDETQGIGAGLGPQIFIDTDDDMIENYLDDDDDGDGVLTIDEDYNGNSNPIDDDTNNNNIPDFLDVDVALGIVSQELAGLIMYPNPAKDLLNISIPNLESEAILTIYSIQGKQLTSEILNNNTTTKNINVAGLQGGVYFLRIETSNGSLTKKFVME